jgi:hypothetical protein
LQIVNFLDCAPILRGWNALRLLNPFSHPLLFLNAPTLSQGDFYGRVKLMVKLFLCVRHPVKFVVTFFTYNFVENHWEFFRLMEILLKLLHILCCF